MTGRKLAVLAFVPVLLAFPAGLVLLFLTAVTAHIGTLECHPAANSACTSAALHDNVRGVVVIWGLAVIAVWIVALTHHSGRKSP